MQPSAELNAAQAAAVAHAQGPLLVFAGAGSGKTRVITYRIASLLAEHGVAPYRILAVTFTNKAAGEMKGRLRKLAGDEVTEDLWIGTFHSVCARFLRRYHDEVGLGRSFTIYDDSDQKAVVSRILKERNIDDRTLPPKLVLSRIHGQKREGQSPDEVRISPVFPEELVDVYRDYQARLTASNAVDFEDLILHVMRIAENQESAAGRDLRRRFDHVLVDEFQDTNLIQYRLVRALAAEKRNLCVVGDDDQSIYRWRGADVRLIRGFRRDFAGAEVVKLEQNYRSTANIVAAALGVIKPAHEREPKELWTLSAPGEPVRVRAVRDEREEAAFVVGRVKAELARGVSASEIAVFYRVHAQSRVLEEGFRSENVPYQIVGGLKFFDRAEVKNLLSYLRLIDNPRSDTDLIRIINLPARGIGNKTVEKLLEIASHRGTSAYDAIEATLAQGGLGTAAKKKLLAFQELLEGLRDAAQSMSPSELAGRVLEDTGYRQALRDDDSAESDARLENLEELLGSILEFEEDQRNAGETPSVGGYLERISLVTAVDALRDVPSVSLMTVHAAKGLEFETVLITGMEEETFPYRGLDSDALEELDEERRLAYVAITRARQRLFLIHASARMLFGQTRYLAKSRFLGDLPRSGVVFEGHPGSGYSGYSGPGSSPRAPSGWRSFGRRQAEPKLEPGSRYIDRDAFDDMVDDAPGREVHPGDRVKHRRYGEGVVESVELDGIPRIVARFPGFGTKKILAKFLELS